MLQWEAMADNCTIDFKGENLDGNWKISSENVPCASLRTLLVIFAQEKSAYYEHHWKLAFQFMYFLPRILFMIIG